MNEIAMDWNARIRRSFAESNANPDPDVVEELARLARGGGHVGVRAQVLEQELHSPPRWMVRCTRRSCSYSGLRPLIPAACAAMRVVPRPKPMPATLVWS